MDEDRVMAALGELPPDLDASYYPASQAADRTMTDGEDADADPSFLAGPDDEKEEEGEEEGADEVGSTGTAPDLASADFLEMNKVAGKEEAEGTLRPRDAMEAVLTPNQRASVAELFEKKKGPERTLDRQRKLAVAFLVTADPDFPAYEPYEEASWWPHRSKVKDESKRPGVKAAIVRTELRGPKSAMFTMYVLHVRTAFHVRGVSRRYSDFVVLDKKLRARFPSAPELKGTSRLIGTLSPSFIQERRQLLQEYLDLLLADHQLAHSDVARSFLALQNLQDGGLAGGLAGDAEGESLKEELRRVWDASAEPVAELMGALGGCKTAAEAPTEARLLNKIGLVLCETEAKQAEGLEYLQRAVAACRLLGDRRALLRTLSNLACAHLKFGGRGVALELLDETVEIAQRVGETAVEAACLRKIALAQATDGDLTAGLRAISEAIELYVAAEDRRGEASARFCAGVMEYEQGAVVAGVKELEKSLALRRALKDKLGIAEALNRLGLALVDIGFHLQALDYFERALALCQEEGDTVGEASTLRLLAFVHLAQVDGNRKLCLELFKKSLTISRRNGDTMGVAICQEGIGDVQADTDDPKAAITHYNQALQMRQDSGEAGAQQRHVQLLRSKLARAKAQVLEAAGGDQEGSASDEEGGGGDFLWRTSMALGGDSDGGDTGLAPPDGDGTGAAWDAGIDDGDGGGMAYYKEMAQHAMSRALTRLWT